MGGHGRPRKAGHGMIREDMGPWTATRNHGKQRETGKWEMAGRSQGGKSTETSRGRGKPQGENIEAIGGHGRQGCTGPQRDCTEQHKPSIKHEYAAQAKA